MHGDSNSGGGECLRWTYALQQQRQGIHCTGNGRAWRWWLRQWWQRQRRCVRVAMAMVVGGPCWQWKRTATATATARQGLHYWWACAGDGATLATGNRYVHQWAMGAVGEAPCWQWAHFSTAITMAGEAPYWQWGMWQQQWWRWGGATLTIGAISDVYGVGEGSRWLWACVATSTFLSRWKGGSIVFRPSAF